MDNIIRFGGGPKSVPDICKNCGHDFPRRSNKKLVKEDIEKNDKDSVFLRNTITDKFHLVAKQSRQRYDERTSLDIKDEYHTQDLLHEFLKIYYDDVRTEEWDPNYAGCSTRYDFLLKEEKIVIEVKKARSGRKTKQLGEQLTIDIAKYKPHPDLKVLYCLSMIEMAISLIQRESKMIPVPIPRT